MGKRSNSRYGNPPVARRASGQSFLMGRAFGFNLGHAIGFEAGYDKGYAEGATLGYNNGFLRALQLIEEGGDTAGDLTAETLLCLLKKLTASGSVSITLSGTGSGEAASLLTRLGMSVLGVEKKNGP